MRTRTLIVATALAALLAVPARAQEAKAPGSPAAAEPSPPPAPPAPAAQPAPPAADAPADAAAPTPPPGGSWSTGAAGTAAPPAGEAPPPPAVVPPPEPAAPPPPGGLVDEEHLSGMRVAAWVTTAAAVALLASGAIVGLAAQERADEITRQQQVLDSKNLPQPFTPTLEQRFKDLRSEGQTYNGLAIGLLSAAGAAAITSAVLFIVDHRRQGAGEKAARDERHRAASGPRGLASRLRLVPSLSPQGAGLGAALVF